MATPKRIPTFQFYAHAWLGSIAVETMPAEVEGTYIRLLAKLWISLTQGEGRLLPADPKHVRLLTKLSESQWRKAWPLLEPHFPLTDDAAGRVNPTLLAVWTEREAFVTKQRANGESGGRPPKNPTLSRATPQTPEKQEPKRKPAITQAFSEPNPNESSVSVSGTDTPPPADAGAPSPSPNRDGDAEREPRRVLRPAVPIGPGFAEQYEQLAGAALPYQRAALDALLAASPMPDILLGSIHAIATGMHEVRSEKGEKAGPEHVLIALGEAAVKFFHSGRAYDQRLFRGCVRDVINRKPEPSPADQCASEDAVRQAAPTLVVERTLTPEEKRDADERRRLAMRQFYLEAGDTERAKRYDLPPHSAAA